MKSRIRFVPLDLPELEFKQTVLDEFVPDTDFYFWSEEYITVRDRSIQFHDAMPMKDTHKELQQYVQDNFPFTDIVLMKLIRANRDVKPHVDDNYIDYDGPERDYNTISREFRDHQLDTEPCGYRIIISGDRKSLYLTDGAPTVIDGVLTYGVPTQHIPTEVPTTTDCFALQSYGSMHGVKKTDGDDDRLLLFVVGWLDKDKHSALINRSRIKYMEYMK
jgi:hypothetical protein